MCTHHQVGQAGQLPEDKVKMDIERFPRQAEGVPTDRSWDLVNMSLEVVFLQKQSYDMNRDVVSIATRSRSSVIHYYQTEDNLHLS